MNNIARVAGLAIIAATLLPSWPAAAEEPTGVLTLFRVLVGKPESVGAPRTQVLDFPGPFVMLGRSAEQEASDVLQLMSKLKEGYRLSQVDIAGTSVVLMKQDRDTGIQVPPGDVRVSATLLAFDEKLATYAVSVAKAGERPSVAKVAIARGERGLIGTRDGAQAPYLFLTVEPLPAARTRQDEPAVYPKLVVKVSPEFPEEARLARLGGVVILECTVAPTGDVRDVKVIRSEPMGLTEAAIKAVSQWNYDPARDARGQAIAAPLTLTINFLLR